MTSDKLRLIRSRKGSCVPLFVLAGLPKATAVPVQEALSKSRSLPPGRYVTADFPMGDFYTPIYLEPAIEALVRQAGLFAIKRRRATYAESETSPTRIYLLFVASGSGATDEERLLDAFDFFAFPYRVGVSTEGKHVPWRFDLEEAVAQFSQAVRSVPTLDEVAELDRRLVQSAKQNVLGLPPRNFHSLGGGEIATSYRTVRTPGEDWTQLDELISPMKFLREDLPKAISGPRKYLFVDDRGLVFPPDPQQHGGSRELPEGKVKDVREIQHLLNQMYRFGFPLREGYHHDVQRVGKDLENERMWCSRRGAVEVSDTHANVYPNDFIRGEVD